MLNLSKSAAGRRWFVVQLKPNCSSIAERNLARQGFITFAPFEERRIRRGQRFLQTQQLLFPGYMFVSVCADTSPWRSINATHGVARLVGFGAGEPTAAPAAFITQLIERCDEGGRLLPLQSFSQGEEVRMVTGPFAELIATVEHMASEQRVWLLLDIMGHSRRVMASAQNLRPVATSRASPARAQLAG